MYRTLLTSLLACLFLGTATLQAQDEIAAQIQKTSVKPVIDGLGNDAIWASATAHGMSEFVNHGDELDGDNDLNATWKAMWDDENLYVLIDVIDDQIVKEDNCDWQDDSVEIYIDAQNLDVEEYNIGGDTDDVPAYQLTALAGFDANSICGRTPYMEFEKGSKSWFTQGINSYDDGGDEASTRYPQGTDTSKAVIINDTHYSFEVAFPWTSLEETPANIIKNGAMGFGVGVNDDDIGDDGLAGGRNSQPIWGTDKDDLWHRSDTMPSVALSTQVIGGGGKPGDFDADNDLDAADIDALSAAARAGNNPAKYDVTGDGKVDSADRDTWINTLRKTYAGDSNLDGEFSSADFVSVFGIGEYEDATANNSTWGDGDWDGNGDFESGDFVYAFASGGYELGPRAAIAAVPEPASLTLFGLGMLMIARRRRR